MRLIGDTLSSSFWFLVILVAQIVSPGITGHEGKPSDK